MWDRRNLEFQFSDPLGNYNALKLKFKRNVCAVDGVRGNQLCMLTLPGLIFNLSTQNARVFVVCNCAVCFYITQQKTTCSIQTIHLRLTLTRTISIGDKMGKKSKLKLSNDKKEENGDVR